MRPIRLAAALLLLLLLGAHTPASAQRTVPDAAPVTQRTRVANPFDTPAPPTPKPTLPPTTTAAPKTEAKKKRKPSATEIVGYVLADLLLLCGAALFAGLTLSVMGLDTMSLEIIADSGTEPDKTFAAKILPIRRKGNQLLCTLILGNVMVNTLIAQITDKFISGWVGVAVSTLLITLGGEIIPQATMAAHALKVGASSAPIVKFFLIVFYPVCKPIALFLDRVIGNDPGQVYDRGELRKLFALHAQQHGAESGLEQGDVDLLFGAMDMHEKTVADVMTPIGDIFMLEASERINDELLQRVWATGHSRIPVYKGQRANIIGLLFVKDLLTVDSDEAPCINDYINFYQHHIITTWASRNLFAMLTEFQTGRSHMALVRQITVHGHADPTYETTGIVTLDDVLGSLMRNTIQDEFDSTGEVQADDEGGDTTMVPLVTTAAVLRYGDSTLREAAHGTVPGQLLRLLRRAHLTENHLKATALFLRDSVAAFHETDVSDILRAIKQHGILYEVAAPQNARGLSMESRANAWLYRRGIATTFFTLIISGRVQVIVGGGSTGETERFQMELPSWSVLAQPLLAAPGKQYVPDFDARVVQGSTVLQFDAHHLARLVKRKPHAHAH